MIQVLLVDPGFWPHAVRVRRVVQCSVSEPSRSSMSSFLFETLFKWIDCVLATEVDRIC